MEQLLSFGIGLHLLQHDINVSPSLRVSSGVTRPALAALASHDQASGAVFTFIIRSSRAQAERRQHTGPML